MQACQVARLADRSTAALNKKEITQSTRSDFEKGTNVKTLVATVTGLAVLGLSAPSVSAGDREWATAGKVLTGLLAGAAIAKAIEPVPVYQAPAYYPVRVAHAPPRVVIYPD